MRFYSVDVEWELTPQRLELPADLLGHHLRLQFACAHLELFGGIIRNCRRWSEVRWRSLAGVAKRTLRRLERSQLVSWIGDDLVVARFNSYRIADLQQRRCDGSKYAKRRWSGHRSPNGSPNAKDLGSKNDPGGDRSRPPATATADPSSSSIEVVEAGGGRGLPDGEWERIWAELPNRRSYWREKARAAIEAVVVPEEVVDFLDWLTSGKKTPSWRKSPPTPLMIASDYSDRRRSPPGRKSRPEAQQPERQRERLPSRAEIRATWDAVVNRSRTKETGS